MDTAITVTMFTLIIGSYGFIIKFILNSKSGISKMEFEKHKDAAQYKDNCSEIVKRLEQRADDRHIEIKEGMRRIENLIRNGSDNI